MPVPRTTVAKSRSKTTPAPAAHLTPSPSASPSPAISDDQFEIYLHVLSGHLARRVLGEIAARGEVQPTNLAEATGSSMVSVSIVLRRLRSVGLVQARRDGSRRYYSVDRRSMVGLAAKVVELAGYRWGAEVVDGPNPVKATKASNGKPNGKATTSAEVA